MGFWNGVVGAAKFLGSVAVDYFKFVFIYTPKLIIEASKSLWNFIFSDDEKIIEEKKPSAIELAKQEISEYIDHGHIKNIQDNLKKFILEFGAHGNEEYINKIQAQITVGQIEKLKTKITENIHTKKYDIAEIHIKELNTYNQHDNLDLVINQFSQTIEDSKQTDLRVSIASDLKKGLTSPANESIKELIEVDTENKHQAFIENSVKRLYDIRVESSLTDTSWASYDCGSRFNYARDELLNLGNSYPGNYTQYIKYTNDYIDTEENDFKDNPDNKNSCNDSNGTYFKQST